MKRNKYRIEMFYTDGDHWESQALQGMFLRNLVSVVKWESGKQTPTNWVGYNKLNPSPGRPIKSHTWHIICTDKDMTAILLQSESKILEIKEVA